jgi:hypothetical protein
MKLYRVSFTTIRHGEPEYLIVTKDEEEALKKAEILFNDYSISEYVSVINEIDGYAVTIKDKNIVLEKK